ncbi:MAG: hypothetical protein NTW03_07370 [Verrucomicrobia bacterium]|nr:hypothetical protein [Verrucomicrobiota bacterium]
MSYGWNVAQLCYYRQRWDPPFQLLDKVLISLGDPWEPNGSVLVVGANPAYGTDNHQVLLAVPTNFFTNAAFPVCGDTLSLCINDLFPCPLAVTNNLRRPLLRAVAMSFQGADLDLVPDEGLFDTASGGVLPDYPTGGEDLVASVPDPVGDCISGTGINGEDFTLLRVFQHPAGVLSFELTLDSYWFEDTALYALLLDLDDNPDTGERFQNGTGVLGVDLIAEFSNFDNPIGFPGVLEGRLLFWKNGAYCPLNHIYHLGNGLYGAPGHVYITLPSEFTAPGMAGNRSGKIKMLAGCPQPRRHQLLLRRRCASGRSSGGPAQVPAP